MAVAIAVPGGDDLFSHTDTQKVIIITEPPQPCFGILNIDPKSITAAPTFSEEATLTAMRNLNVFPEDLVPRPPPEADDVVTRLHVAMELERRRFAIIEKIMAERNRILSEPALDILTSGFPTERQKKPKRVKRKSQKKLTEISEISELEVPVRRLEPRPARKSPNRALERVHAVEKRRLELQQQQRVLLEDNAKKRLQKLNGATTTFEVRRKQLKADSDSAFQRDQRRYMAIQEKKRKEFEKEQRERREKIYRAGQTKNTFSQLKREFMAGRPQEILESQPPAPLPELGKPIQPHVARSMEIAPGRVPPRRPLVPVRATVDARSALARKAPVVRLPVVGKGKTKIPLFRR
jgi:hypothetical protein